MAVTTPVALTVATAGVPLLQTPNAIALERAVVAPMQTLALPVMLATTGRALTVIVVDTAVTHPFALVTVYEITEVPDDIAVTTPVALTVATAGVALLHIPDAVALARAVVAPTQTLAVPVILATTGRALTVIVVDTAVTHPFALVTV
jgi:hypothetical protein